MFLREAQDEDEMRRLKGLARKIARWLKIIGENGRTERVRNCR